MERDVKTYYAHTSPSEEASAWQPLEEHLLNVAETASRFAAPFCCEEWAYAAGILHDVGKGCAEFQKRLQGKHPAIDHSIAGASIASNSKSLDGTALVKEGAAISPVIAGHHVGLQDYYGEHSLRARMESYERGEIPHTFVSDLGVNLPEGTSSVGNHLKLLCQKQEQRKEFLSFGMFTLEHLLFSSLVDADWLDTERFMSPEEYARRQAAQEEQDSLSVLAERLDAYLDTFDGKGDINRVRAACLSQAREGASKPAGIYELNMPTGSGKTLTSLSFALRHAVANGQDRVIYAIPFMSIVEQNSQVFRDVLGRENVVEHVSSYDFGLAGNRKYDQNEFDWGVERDHTARELGLRERMLAQNWDAPVVVTTNVQLFESLFSNRPAKSRKLHNIANSVIVLDEAQSLPDSLLIPTLAMLESLVALANVTVVLCTATQPALMNLWPLQAKPTSLVNITDEMAAVFSGRVRFDCIRGVKENAYTLDSLIDELVTEKQVLCIVSSRRAARLVYNAMRDKSDDSDGLYHLSALMVPEHRLQVLDSVRSRLKEGLPCRVVSTQLVEAGVDFDFPVVYREISGTDSMLQAAGRCNREGKMEHPGRVVVFDCVDFETFRSHKPNWLGKMRSLGTEGLVWANKQGKDPFGEECVRWFFERRHQTGCLDGKSSEPIYGLITKADASTLSEHVTYCHYPFETIARRYRFIKEENVCLFVPWGDVGSHLLELIENNGFEYDLYPLLQRYCVSIPQYLYREYERMKAIRRINSFPVPVLETRKGVGNLYDCERGLMAPDEGELDVLVV